LRLDRASLLRAIPDVPSCIEVRGMLRDGVGEATGLDVRQFVMAEPSLRLAVTVGWPLPRFVLAAIARCPGKPVILTGSEYADRLARWLPEWKIRPAHRFVLHEPVKAMGVQPARFVSWSGLAASALGQFEILGSGLLSGTAAAVWAGGVPVSICAASWETETYCDLMVETLPAYRGRGFAAAVVAAMAGHAASQGRKALWFAEADQPASIRLAAKLGFTLASSLATMRPE
jgi:GNAT superfamily N-acetyltransferase